jgi:HTH-type transcriptional regulator / antitoxin HigA
MIIENEVQYKQAFKEFDALILTMNEDVSKQRQARQLAEAIQQYEMRFISFPKPTTVVGLIELKMYEMRIKQKDLAELLGIESSRLSEFLNGKRKLTIELAKKLHDKLGIDGNFLLENA